VVFIIKGKTKTKVEAEVRKLIDNMESRGSFSYFVDIRKTKDGWQGTLQMFWYK